MKKLIAFAFLFFVSHCLHAQTSPRVISYQGLLRPAGSMSGNQIAGNRLLTVTLYGDANGTVKLWQSTINTLIDSSGVFNCLLGTPDNPLPNSAAMDRPMWIGIAVDHNSEMRPFAQFTASPYALNVADSSITSSKLNMNYVSSISVNGQPITGVGTNLNLVAGDGLNLTWVPTASTLTLSGTGGAGDGKTMSVDWELGGNSISSPPMQFLGTIDSAALEIHVNSSGDTLDGNGRVMLYQPMQSSANIVGGFRTNYVTSTDSGGDVIAGGGNYTHPNWIAGNFGTVSGGYGNTAYSGGVVGGGTSNFANITATVAGGTSNAAALGGTVGGGIANITSEEYTTISGGWSNTINLGAIGPPYPEGLYSSIGGGDDNNIYGPGSTIPGGGQLNLGSFSFGYNGDSLQVGGSPRVTDLSLVQGIGYFGNVNVMIGNVDSVARQLRFYGPNTSLTYGSSAKYTAFCAPLMDSDVLYTLPNAQGANSTVLTEDGHGNLSWSNQLGASGWLITGNSGTSAPPNFIGTLDSNAFEIHLFNTAASTGGNKRVMRYELGATSPNLIGGSSANAVNAKLSGAAVLSGGSLTEPNQVLDSFSVIAGGEENFIDSVFAPFSVISGGQNNAASGAYAVVAGGGGDSAGPNFPLPPPTPLALLHGGIPHFYSNTALAAWTVVGGGYGNSAQDTAATVAGGAYNIADGLGTTVGGGGVNDAYDTFATVSGGEANGAGSYSFVGGGYFNQAGATGSTVAGGLQNTAGGTGSTVGGGVNNNISDSNATIAGGNLNYIDAGSPYAFIGSGDSNYILGASSVIAGGNFNSVKDSNSAIAGGTLNYISSGAPFSFVGGGQSDSIVSSAYSFIGNGLRNMISTTNSFNAIMSGQENFNQGHYCVIGGGEWDTIRSSAEFSMIGSGFQNVVGGAYSAIVGGYSQYIRDSANLSFIGAGQNDSVFAVYSGIASGFGNRVDTNADYAFVGGGNGDTVHATSSFIGGGEDNTTSLISGAGKCASIPGGDNLKTQSYAQTAMGFYNMPGGVSIDPYSAKSLANGDNALVIVGNGLPDTTTHGTTVSRRSNAWTLANAGYSTAYDSIGPGNGMSGVATHMGSTYRDNTIFAWGNILAGDSILANIGVQSVAWNGTTKQYTIQLNVLDAGGSLPHTFTANNSAVVAIITGSASGAPGIIEATPVVTTGGVSTFTITTWTLGAVATNSFGFMFYVVGK